MRVQVSLVIPCYNEEKVLPLFYDAVSQIVREMEVSYELIFVDDGSEDGTLRFLRQIAAEDEHIVYISFSRNFGKEAAIYAGLSKAKGEYAAIMDADMQDPPSLLPQMYKIIAEDEYDCVATRRISRKGEPPIRSFFARCFYFLIRKMSDVEIVDGARDFRMMNRKMLNAVLQIREYNRFSKGIFGWVGFRTYWIGYENIERAAGQSKWDFWGLTRYAFDGILNFSQVPLTWMAAFGFFFTFFALAGSLFIIVRKLLFGDPVPGWASTMCVIVLMGGFQMFFLGIIGQYLSKMYVEMKGRPLYVIAETNAESAEQLLTNEK